MLLSLGSQRVPSGSTVPPITGSWAGGVSRTSRTTSAKGCRSGFLLIDER